MTCHRAEATQHPQPAMVWVWMAPGLGPGPPHVFKGQQQVRSKSRVIKSHLEANIVISGNFMELHTSHLTHLSPR